jgi:hypothetical protein
MLLILRDWMKWPRGKMPAWHEHNQTFTKRCAQSFWNNRTVLPPTRCSRNKTDTATSIEDHLMVNIPAHIKSGRGHANIIMSTSARIVAGLSGLETGRFDLLDRPELRFPKNPQLNE